MAFCDERECLQILCKKKSRKSDERSNLQLLAPLVRECDSGRNENEANEDHDHLRIHT